jgi:plastocyanin
MSHQVCPENRRLIHMRRNNLHVFWIVALIGLSSLSTLTQISEASQSRHTPAVSIQGFSFNPATNLTVHVGDTVAWTNDDGDPHTATSTTGPTSFDSGVISSGDIFNFTFTTAGTYDYHCSFHTSMTASLTVVEPQNNNPPEVSNLTLTPNPVMTNDVISVFATTSDVDGDSVTLSYSWLINGNFISETGNTLAGPSWFEKNDQIQLEITPNDGHINGNTVISSTITISNSPPSISSAIISPLTLNNESVATCIVSGWNDEDGDAVSYHYAWQVNGIIQQNGDESSGPFNAGDIVSCIVTPDDGENNGTSISSNNITVVAVDDPDADEDGVPDTTDSCSDTPAGEIVDAEGCSSSQLDEDEDGVSDANDLCAGTPQAASVDNEGCGSSQLDSDGDGFHDGEDAFPIDENEHIDTDNDGIGDNADNDDDDDGWDDDAEIDCNTNSTDASSNPLDTDSDGICDLSDDDDDNDGWNDTAEFDCNTNSTDTNSVPPDADDDGICNVLDDINGNTPPPGYEYGNTSQDTDPMTIPPKQSDDAGSGMTGFTSVLAFTSIAGALVYLKRRHID